MPVRPPSQLKIGDELTANWLESLRKWVIRNTISLGANSGLVMSESDSGKILRTSNPSPPQGTQLAITNGTVSARSSTTAGSGTVYLTSFDGTTITKLDGSGGTKDEEVAVFNFSSTTGGIATGIYVWITQDPDGYWWIVSVDCGN